MSTIEKHWTRAEYEALEASGLWEEQKLELVDGELISKRGKKRPHVSALTLMYARLMQIFGSEALNVAASIDVAPEDNLMNEPEPDIIVLKRPVPRISVKSSSHRFTSDCRGIGYHARF